jgi:hypothetical protein
MHRKKITKCMDQETKKASEPTISRPMPKRIPKIIA